MEVFMINKHNTLWTGDDLWQLAEMYNDGKPVDKIAKKLGRTQSSVTGKISEVKKAFDGTEISEDNANDIMKSIVAGG